MARMIDEETGEVTDEPTFMAIYDQAVRDVGEAKAEVRSLKDQLKEAKATEADALKRLQELRKDRNRPRQLPLAGSGRR